MEPIKVIPSTEQNLNESSTNHQVEIHSNLKDSNPSISDQLPTETLPSFHPLEEEEKENTEDLTSYSLTGDRRRRTIRPLSRFARANCIANSSIETIEDEPYSYEDALYSRHSNQWKEAMNDELNSLYKNDTWEQVEKPHGKIIIPCKWVFKKKMIGDLNNKVKFKARLVAKGFKQKGDVTTAFLHGSLEEEIFMEQPCLIGFIRSLYDPCVYYKKLTEGDYIYLLLYVDDMLLAGRDPIKLKEIKAQLSVEFDMKDLGAAKKILRIEILRDRNNNELSLTQKTYTNKARSSSQFKSCQPVYGKSRQDSLGGN
ncbi:retrotransposon protein, putative, Ty1-copia subclass [Cucumis melo var. makuwa]|uniref:Retrotransposon protein, putative, Ty1-copia subclass n=1 Tax=Cucumis melo var. makuwa TaxID=1194695 RepID=A0A5D3CYI6_CUCMM|nr:retrotransposon protein, putative, Ty1-copia subclass [Cucumis melo var. makuwa]TYK16420.1 retrotransposon protein, putative, Ty1-copia subclass [Cucumis melo var. makuwa]